MSECTYGTETKDKEFATTRSRIKAGVAGGISGQSKPVSYTHLDVYKRQSLVMGISSATDVKQVGRIGSKILLIYMCTTVVASAVGIAGGMILKPGVGVNLGSFDLSSQFSEVETSFADVILDFIPTNIVASFAEGEMIHIVLFAVFVGIAMSLPVSYTHLRQHQSHHSAPVG